VTVTVMAAPAAPTAAAGKQLRPVAVREPCTSSRQQQP
jgi:hypothetical protein